MKYRVKVTDAAFDLIEEQAQYIAVDCKSPLNATRWLQQVFEAIDELEEMPNRHILAPENAYKTYEVRRVLVGRHFILFTIDDSTTTVSVIGRRYGSRLPRPNDLPSSPPID